MPQDNTFEITFDKFYTGFSPLAHLDSLTEIGGAGSASSMTDCDILDPTYITQGSGFTNLINATELVALTEQINFIMDIPSQDGISYGIGDTKLYQITPTTLVNDETFPYTITNCTQGESVIFISTI